MFHKTLAAFLAIGILISGMPIINLPAGFSVFELNAHAEEENKDFKISNGIITEYYDTSNVLLVPPTINGQKVVGIGSEAFMYSRYDSKPLPKFIMVELPDTVKEIQTNAFQGQDELVEITMPQELETIGFGVFSNCRSLSKVTLNEGLKEIGAQAFSGCFELKNITIPSTVTVLKNAIFSRTEIETIRFMGACPEKYNDETFLWDSKHDYAEIEGLTIYYPKVYADTYTEMIEMYPWINWVVEDSNDNLSTDSPNDDVSFPVEDFEYSISNNKVTITRYAGNDTNIVIPSEIDSYPVSSIGEFAFSGYNSLISVTIPDGVTSIEREAFYECGNLASIDIPESVTYIGMGAFTNCVKLTNIDIPNGVTSIENRTFENCRSLRSIDIPNSVTSIGYLAFGGCRTLTNITIPNSVTFIGDNAFAACLILTNVEIPNSVISIGREAFFNCQHLTSVFIPENVKSIGEDAFDCCPSDIIIYGVTGSEAERYADSMNHNFVAVSTQDSSEADTPYIRVDAGDEDGLVATVSGGRGMDVNIESNTNWRVEVVSGSEWIALSCESGSGNRTFYTTTSDNTNGTAREGWIKVSADGCEPINIKVTQGQNTFEPDSFYSETEEPQQNPTFAPKPTPTNKPNPADTDKYLGDMYIVNCNEWVSLRSKRSSTSTRIAKVPKGTLVHDVYISNSNDFAVCSYNGQTGYIQKEYLGKQPDNNVANLDDYRGDMYIINCEDWVSLRAKPDASSTRLVKVPLGATVDCRNYDYGDFAYVYYNGEYGYILKKYLGGGAASEEANEVADTEIQNELQSEAYEALIESDLGIVASLHNLEQYSVVFDNGYDDTYAYYVIDGIPVKANMGLDGEGKKFYGQKDANGNYMSAVWVHSEYDYIANFKESRSLFDNIFQARKESSINKEYVVDGKNQNLAFSHILYMSPHDVLLYKTFIEKEVSLQGIYGILHSVCTFIGLNIEEVLPYNEFLFLLFDNGNVLSGDNFDFYKVWNLVADYLLPFAENMPAAKVFKELKSSIKIDTFWKVLNEGGIPAVAASLDKIIDFKSISKSIAENGIKAALDVGEAAIKIGAAFVSFTVEWAESIAKMWGSSANVVELINGTNNMNYGLTVYFYYNPNEYVQKHEYQAYYNGRKPVDLFGTYAVYNLFEFKSPSDDEQTQKGILTFDRNFVWHVLLEYLGT